MEKNNKLIAEFMGLKEHEGSYYLPLYNSGDWVPDVELEYHSSWGWLMPVVQKIGNDYYNTPFNELNNKVNTWTLEDTYNAVVEFIKNQNN